MFALTHTHIYAYKNKKQYEVTFAKVTGFFNYFFKVSYFLKLTCKFHLYFGIRELLGVLYQMITSDASVLVDGIFS